MSIIKDGRMPCRITDGPQYDDQDFADHILDMEPCEFLAAASERIPKTELLDWFFDALVDELDNNDHEEFKRLLEAVVSLEKDRHDLLWNRLNATAGYIVNNAFERAAKNMMKNEDVAQRVFYRE
mgnify:CR=1 FL=1